MVQSVDTKRTPCSISGLFQRTKNVSSSLFRKEQFFVLRKPRQTSSSCLGGTQRNGLGSCCQAALTGCSDKTYKINLEAARVTFFIKISLRRSGFKQNFSGLLGVDRTLPPGLTEFHCGGWWLQGTGYHQGPQWCVHILPPRPGSSSSHLWALTLNLWQKSPSNQLWKEIWGYWELSIAGPQISFTSWLFSGLSSLWVLRASTPSVSATKHTLSNAATCCRVARQWSAFRLLAATGTASTKQLERQKGHLC